MNGGEKNLKGLGRQF